MVVADLDSVTLADRCPPLLFLGVDGVHYSLAPSDGRNIVSRRAAHVADEPLGCGEHLVAGTISGSIYRYRGVHHCCLECHSATFYHP